MMKKGLPFCQAYNNIFFLLICRLFANEWSLTDRLCTPLCVCQISEERKLPLFTSIYRPRLATCHFLINNPFKQIVAMKVEILTDDLYLLSTC